MEKEEFYNLISDPETIDSRTLEKLKETINEFPFFQTAWLLYLKNLKKVDDFEYQNLLKKGALRIPDRKQLYYFLNKKLVSAAEPTITKKTTQNPFEYNLGDAENRNHGNSLIDKFLLSGTSPIRIKNEMPDDNVSLSDNEMIEQSIHDDDEIITETLAMIYFDQKKYDKALEAFKKLSLKYPEKSIYFATRIAEIEQLKNI